MSLSLSTTSRSTSRLPAWLSASKASPAVSAPSPMTATTRRSSLLLAAATAMPSAALIEVLEWPTPKVSYSLSARFGNGASPPCWRIVLNASAATGQNLVRIGLMADIPDQAVIRRVEHVVQGDRQFHRAQIGGKVTAGLAHGLDQKIPQLLR